MGLAAMHLLTRAATHSMNRFTQELTEKAAQQQQARTSEAERQQETQLAIKAQQQWETEQERQQALFERERRAAFDAQYLAPKGCDNPPSNTAFTECVNHKMRARQSFFNAYTPAGINPAQSTATQTSSPIIKAGG
jgi:hypothetical protein